MEQGKNKHNVSPFLRHTHLEIWRCRGSSSLGVPGDVNNSIADFVAWINKWNRCLEFQTKHTEYRQRHLLLFSRMSKASLRKFREYYVTTAFKWVTNLSVFCARVSQDQRTNPLPFSAEVLFTRSAALQLITISYIMDRLTEPWKQG